jgi:hypothetical protein
MKNGSARFCALALAGVMAAACGEKEPYIPPVVGPTGGGGGGTDPVPYEFVVGSLFGFEQHVRRGHVKEISDNGNSTHYNLPLFTGTEEEWWDNLVEEFAYSGMDYAMANCRGLAPDPKKYNDHGDPRHLKKMVEAMERRGVADKFKIAIFDDCPASWGASRNMDLHNDYTPAMSGPDGKPKYDYPLDNLDGEGGIYKYIWDYNIKLAFRNVPDKYLLKFQGRPVLFLWSVNNFLNPAGENGYFKKLSPILKRLREDFKKEFAVDPYIVVDRAFNDRDKSVDYPVVDGINDWFGMDNPATVRTVNKVPVGVAIPGFSINDRRGNHMFVDANHGKRLIASLEKLKREKSQIILVEGFTDVYENAALWRSVDTRFYDYPNQRLNIMRRYGNNPWPKELKVEAEACDYYNDNTPENSGGAFRKGGLDVEKCGDALAGWNVTDAEGGEWLQWKELPLRAGRTTFSLRYSSTAAAEVSFKVGATVCPAVKLPSTGGEWKTLDAGSVTLDKQGLHDVTLNVVSGEAEINYFRILAAE